ncbi:MAG TPA: TetR/AcrR family transcriptional regulator [Chthonomonadaceae bacterium]|nr:TetR/AcrR family transcriptional regulator [Chthonomonadaceae bacterium]
MKSERQTGPDRRLMLLQAALALFSTLGYEGTTTRAIAERVGVTEALLFKHFRTKEELLRAVVAEFGPRRQLPLASPETLALPVRDALEQILAQYLDAFWANRACLRMLVIETWRDPEALHELREQFAERTQMLAAFLECRTHSKELRSEIVPALTDVISTATSGFLHRSIRTEPENWTAARAQFLTYLMSVLFDGIVASPDSERMEG